MVGGPGSQHAVFNPQTMGTMEAPSSMSQNAWAKPFYALATSNECTLFDLRPIRSKIRRLGDLPAAVVKVLYGYDAVVVLGGSGPQKAIAAP